MNRYFTLLVLFVFVSGGVWGQNLRFRLSANSGLFLGEVGKPEIEPSNKKPHPGSENFKPSFRYGAELEIIKPITPDFEMGMQFGYLNLHGETPTAPLYNFFLSRDNPLFRTVIYPNESLIYDTNILSILGSARSYVLPFSRDMVLFLKLLGGVSFVGTDFTFRNPADRLKYDGVMLFSTGTKSNEDPKVAALTGGLGLGTTYRMSDKFDFYFDATVLFIHSDIVNGVPNYNYILKDGRGSMQRTNTLSVAAQASIGLIYNAIPDRRVNRSNITRSSKVSKKMFHKKKRSKPFSKRRK